jgi:UDPglucose 6-dehydrogenase
MKIAIIGTGYVGLVSGTCFAELGASVICVEKDKAKLESLKKGNIPIYEPGLEELVEKNRANSRLKFTSNLEQALKESEVCFIAVGTPSRKDGGADLSYVFAAAREIANTANDGIIIVTKSTVPVGTGDEIKKVIKKENPKLKFSVSSNPEFLREGNAVKDFLEPDRVIIGAENKAVFDKVAALYSSLSHAGVTILSTDIRTAELTKYAANGFLATKIAFINEMADICESLGANIELVSKGMGLDPRIGATYLSPGPGFGGSCFPKDTLALKKISADAKAPSKLIDSVIKSNDSRKENMAKKIIKSAGGKVKGKNIAVLGLAFKANTDDMREAASLSIIPALIKAGASIKTYDPEATSNAQKLLSSKKITWCKNMNDALKNADIITILTEWNEFLHLDFAALAKQKTKPVIVDLRNLFDVEKIASYGLEYYSIGR